jgi:hypothetical protein
MRAHNESGRDDRIFALRSPPENMQRGLYGTAPMRRYTLRMRRMEPVAVMLALLGLLFILMAVQIARDRAHQQPLGVRTTKLK